LTDPSMTHPKEAKVLLGKRIVTQFYDEATAEAAAAEFDKIFAQKQLPDEIPDVAIVAAPLTAAKLVLHCRLVNTGGEAKRMIQQGGVRVNDAQISDANTQITPENGMVVQVGKRKFARLIVR